MAHEVGRLIRLVCDAKPRLRPWFREAATTGLSPAGVAAKLVVEMPTVTEQQAIAAAIILEAHLRQRPHRGRDEGRWLRLAQTAVREARKNVQDGVDDRMLAVVGRKVRAALAKGSR